MKLDLLRISMKEFVDRTPIIGGNSIIASEYDVWIDDINREDGLVLSEIFEINGIEGSASWILICSSRTIVSADFEPFIFDPAVDLFCSAGSSPQGQLFSIDSGVILNRRLVHDKDITLWIRGFSGYLFLDVSKPLNNVVCTELIRDNLASPALNPGGIICAWSIDQTHASIMHCYYSGMAHEICHILNPEGSEEIILLQDGTFLAQSRAEYGKWFEAPEGLLLSWNNRVDCYYRKDGNWHTGTGGDRLLRNSVNVRSSDTQDCEAEFPKIIHFIWIGSSLPYWGEMNVASWEINNKGWITRIWTDQNADEIEQLFDQQELFFYYSLSSSVLKADILRMAILRMYGGVYVDVDFVCYSGFLDELVGQGKIGWGEKPGGLPECALILSIANHPFLTWFIWKSIMFWSSLSEEMKSNPTRGDVVWPMNSFEGRVKLYFGINRPIGYLQFRGRNWCILFQGHFSVKDRVLHGGVDAKGRHDYVHTWW